MSLKKGQLPPGPPPTEGQLWPPYPRIEEPPDDARVWRYLDLPKFIDLLNTSTLYLSRIAVLGDPFEGSYPRANAVELLGDPMSRLGPVRRRGRDLWYVNCWHVNDHESAAMWELYAGRGAGLAVQTSYKALKESIIEE
jgi:hypothetical protein